MERKINPQEATSRCEFLHGGEHQQIIIIQVTIVMRHKEQSAQNVTTITGIHAYCSLKKTGRFGWVWGPHWWPHPHTETSECRRRAHPNFAQHPRFGPVVVDRIEHRIFDLQKVSNVSTWTTGTVMYLIWKHSVECLISYISGVETCTCMEQC